MQAQLVHGGTAPPAGDHGRFPVPVIRPAVHLPPLRQLLRHGGLHAAEGTIIPFGLFYLLLQLHGLHTALFGALAWSYLAVGVRLLRRRRLPALLLLATAMLTLRSAISFATDNPFVYFLQPTLGNFLVGSLFLVSVRLGRPLARRLADDLCPLPAALLDRRPITKIFSRITVLWALVNIVNGSTALAALLSSSLGGLLLARTVGSISLAAFATYLSYVWFRRCVHLEGFTLRWG